MAAPLDEHGARSGEPQEPGEEDTTREFSMPPAGGSDRVQHDAVAAAHSSHIGRRVGRYRIRRLIAAGGMGTVYEAVQDSPRRTVALKVMRHGIASKSALRRFEYESQILARLRHPSIAQVYEAGVHEESLASHREGFGDDGDPDSRSAATPYFAMEYIPNSKSITQYARDRKLGTRERLELFAKVCEAVHHGHQKGIIHRDLKPGNILVDSVGQPKVIDFGVARATDSDLAVTTLQTDVGQLIGTLQYMSPEQCDADPHDLDIRSDVYALGVVLYELLCEQLPYDVSKVAVYEAARVIREVQPPKPSSLNKTVRGDVETIALKALEKERERRYQSALDLSQDIGRYLRGDPIIARPPSLMYQLRVFARRQRGLAASIAVVMAVILLSFLAVSGLLARSELLRREAEHARRDAELARTESERQALLAEHARAEAEEAHLAAVQERDRALLAEEWATAQAYVANLLAAETAWRNRETDRFREQLASCEPRLRRWEWGYLQRRADRSLAVLVGHEGDVHSASFCPYGTRIVTASSDRTARVWDANSGRVVDTLAHSAVVLFAAFSGDGSHILTVAADRIVRLWETASSREVLALPQLDAAVSRASLKPDGKQIVTGSWDGVVRLWDSRSSELTGSMFGHDGSVQSAAYSPDGLRIVTASDDRTARVWDSEAGREVRILSGHRRPVTSAVFSPDGNRIVTASSDRTARIWDAATGRELFALSEHGGAVNFASFSPDGALVATAGADRIVRIWDSGVAVAVLHGHQGAVRWASFNADGTRLVTASSDGTARIWDSAAIETIEMNLRDVRAHDVTFSPDGTRLVISSSDHVARLWDPGTGVETATSFRHRSDVNSAAFNADGTRLVTASSDGTAQIWDSATGERVTVFSNHAAMVNSASFQPDGARVITASQDRTARVWDSETGEEITVVARHERGVNSASFSPDGGRVVTASSDGTARIWDSSTEGRALAALEHADVVNNASFCPDGRHIVTASSDRTACIWNPQTQAILHTLRHPAPVNSAHYSPDGTRIVTASLDGTVRIWDSATGSEVAAIREHPAGVAVARFSPDGTRIASASAGVVRLWDSLCHRRRFIQERGRVSDGSRIATDIVDAAVRAASGDFRRAAERIRNDTILTGDLRRASLDILLVRSTLAAFDESD